MIYSFSKSSSKIKNFAIYGERCSGTNFLETIMTGESYFHQDHKPAFDLPMNSNFGHKHFFGFNDEDIINNGDETLFIGIVRHPYDWMNSLFKKDNLHHIPQKNWSYENFLFSEWYSIEHDRFSKNFMNELTTDNNLLTGERYKNIFELRKTKLEYLLHRMPKIAKNYVLIRYEDLCERQESVIEALSKKFGLTMLNDDYIRSKKSQSIDLLESYCSHIMSNLDWQVEELVEYLPIAQDIKQFYAQTNIPPDFDWRFYRAAYPDASDFEFEFSDDENISEEKKLFYHYHKKGQYLGYNKNISAILPSKNKSMTVENINSRDIQKIIPVHKDFEESYKEKTGHGLEISQQSKISIVGLARDCGTIIKNSLDLIYELDCQEKKIFIYENDSIDETREVIQEYKKNQDNLFFSFNNLNREYLSDSSNCRTQRLADYRNLCLDWIKENSPDYDYVIVVDFDAILGFSIEGIYNSIYWLQKIPNAGGMGSYSLCFKDRNLSHYDSFAIRLNHWFPPDELDNNNWVNKWHPAVGSTPIPTYSCFGGLAVYKKKALINAEYDGLKECEHVGFHKSLKKNGWDMYLNPSSRFFAAFSLH